MECTEIGGLFDRQLFASEKIAVPDYFKSLCRQGGNMSPIRIVSVILVAFAALCWVGAAFVGITNSGGAEPAAHIYHVLDMLSAATSSSALLAIALSLVFKD
jgi:hypothetical protein